MIATVKFLSIPGISLSQSVFPVFSAGYEDYVEQTFWNTKVCKDLTQTITVPEFTDYDKCNMVAIGDELYYIDGYTRATNSANSVSFSVKYCAPPNLLTLNTTIDGVWERTPSRTNTLRDILGNSVYQTDDKVSLTTLPQDVQVYDKGTQTIVQHCDIYWVQLTIAGNPQSELVYRSGGINLYGFFMAVSRQYPTKPVRMRDASDSNTEYPCIQDLLDWNNVQSTSGNVGYHVIPVGDVIDISISRRCPYRYRVDDTGTVYIRAEHMPSSSSGAMRPNSYFGYYGKAGDNKATMVMYSLGAGVDANNTIDFAPSSHVTMTYDDVNEVTSLSRTLIYDDMGNPVCEIPPELYTINPTTQKPEIDVEYWTRGDMTGLYTYFKVNNTEYVIPECHVPYSTTAWSQYVAYSMTYDRQLTALQNSQLRADAEVQKQQGWINSISSVATTGAMVAMGGAMAGFKKLATGMTTAGAGGAGILTTALNNHFIDRNTNISVQYNNEAQKLKEQNMKEQSASVFNASNGIYLYIWHSSVNGSHIEKQVMKDYTSAMCDKYHDAFGYPGNGFATLTVEEGYYKGCIDRESISHTGIKGDNLVGMFANGFSIKKVDPVIS